MSVLHCSVDFNKLNDDDDDDDEMANLYVLALACAINLPQTMNKLMLRLLESSHTAQLQQSVTQDSNEKSDAARV